MSLVFSKFNVWAADGTDHFLHNGVSGQTFHLDQAVRRRLEAIVHGSEITSDDAAVLTPLVAGRALINHDVDELAILRTRYQAASVQPRHFGLTVVTSLGCNFDCPYCYEDKKPSILSGTVQHGILRLIDERIEHLDDLAVTWFGGEPLLGLRPLVALSDAILERCERYGVDYEANIVTNGWLLTPENARLLREKKVLSAQITIDGPPDVHDRSRPYVGGGSTFERVVANVRTASEILDVAVRVNIDRSNVTRLEELFEILVERDLVGRISIYPAQITASDHAPAPGFGYRGAFTREEFAAVQIEFEELAMRFGFGASITPLPKPTPSPCTAVRENEVLIGSNGELWKCWEEVGDTASAFGSVLTESGSWGRPSKWLDYDPFTDPDCSTCIALPGCMGGCAVHALSVQNRENRCGDFRFNHQRSVAMRLADYLGKPRPETTLNMTVRPPVTIVDGLGGAGSGCASGCGSGGCGSSSVSVGVGSGSASGPTPVTIGARRRQLGRG